MRAKNLALRVLSTAAMLSIVTSIAAPAFAATYYINEGSVDVKVSDAGVVTVEQGGVTYKDGLDSVVIRGGTRGGKDDDRTKADASPATQEADGSNAPAVNETEAPKSENTAGDAAPKQETTAAGERKEGTPQQEPTEEKVTPEQKPTEEEAEEKETPEPAKAKAEAPKAAQEPSAEQEEEQEEQQEKEDEPTVPSAAPLAAAPAAQADNSSTSTPAKPTENVITIVNNLVKGAKQAFSFVLDNVNIDRSKNYSSNNSAALTVKGDGDTEIELDGNNILKGGSYHAGLEKNDSDGTGTLTIKDEDGSKGSLLAVGNSDSAGIGGSSKGGNGNTSNITITGGNITAISGWYGAGIGGGDEGYGKDITITGDATVKASGYHGAGIGGGASGCADVTISEDATVFAQGYNGGTGIGTGETADPNTSTSVGNRTSIRISDRANVTAISDNIGIGSTSWRDTQTQIEITGGTINIASRSSQYPVIGVSPHDDMTLTINGNTGNTVINAYTRANKDASIGKLESNWQLSSDTDQIQYNEDGSSKFGENGSVILNLFKKALVEKSNNSILCFDGSTALYKITSGEQYDTLHNAQWWMNNDKYTSELATDTTHAWKLDDTKERVEPTLEHEGHVYYKCSVPGCKAVHDEVLPKLESKPTPEPTPDPTPVQPDTPADTQSTPKLYVIDLASTQVLFDETRQNDTVTYTTKQDGASLTGSFEALEAMAEDGVKTIVFQTIGTNTPGAVSRVSVDALLQHGGETLLLTHNGTEVHLTIDGQNADSLLLQ